MCNHHSYSRTMSMPTRSMSAGLSLAILSPNFLRNLMAGAAGVFLLGDLKSTTLTCQGSDSQTFLSKFLKFYLTCKAINFKEFIKYKNVS